MKRVYVALGGNIGDTEKVFFAALLALTELKDVSNLNVSSFYETVAVSPTPQRNYLNAVCSFDTSLSQKELIFALKQIESELGKVPKKKEEARIIDLDIIFYGDETFEDHELIIPHPHWKERPFVTVPLNELLEIEMYEKCHS